MVLEGAMIAIATIALTFLHPGPVFKDFWNLKTAKGHLHGPAEQVEKVHNVETKA